MEPLVVETILCTCLSRFTRDWGDDEKTTLE